MASSGVRKPRPSPAVREQRGKGCGGRLQDLQIALWLHRTPGVATMEPSQVANLFVVYYFLDLENDFLIFLAPIARGFLAKNFFKYMAKGMAHFLHR